MRLMKDASTETDPFFARRKMFSTSSAPGSSPRIVSRAEVSRTNSILGPLGAIFTLAISAPFLEENPDRGLLTRPATSLDRIGWRRDYPRGATLDYPFKLGVGCNAELLSDLGRHRNLSAFCHGRTHRKNSTRQRTIFQAASQCDLQHNIT